MNNGTKTILQRFAEISATGYGLGLAKKAPGTWGSLGGLLIGWLIYTAGIEIGRGDQNIYFFTTVVILLTAFSTFAFWTIKRTETAWGTHDEGKIVIDEFAGQAIAVAFFTPSVSIYIAGFILFRILDIWKPSIIGQADETLPGAWGTLVDDLIAGAVAAVILAGCLYALPTSALILN